MPDYKKMYLSLLNEIANTIDNLKAALEKAEEIYISSNQPNVTLYSLKDKNNEEAAD